MDTQKVAAYADYSPSTHSRASPYVHSYMADQNSALQQSFGKVLKGVRTERGMTQERLAFDSDLDRTFVSLLERGLRQPTLGSLVKLADALAADPAELVRSAVAGTKRKK